MNNDAFEAYIDNYFSKLRPSLLTDAMNYAIKGGKRIRPQLLFAILNGFSIEEKYGYPAALALEMVHAYSLVHDDLPCMDNDDLRRGLPTVHKAFGEANAVLVGDGLLTHAFGVLADSDYDKTIRCKMISELSSLAGLQGMLYGQFLDIQHSNDDMINEELLAEIEDAKTGALFECALFMGMYLAKDEANTEFYSTIARKIGRIYQLQDDLFEVTKDSSITGKSCSDKKNNKATAFSVYRLQELEGKIQELFISLENDLKKCHFSNNQLNQYLQQMKGR